MAGPTVRHLRVVPPPDADSRLRPYGVAVNTTTTGVTAADIAAAFRHDCREQRRHEPTPGQLHRLLYLAQGHHLGWHGRPLFADTIVITDTGVLIPARRDRELDGEPGHGTLTGSQRGAVGYVLSRYGQLYLHDLDLLTRHSAPAVEAGRSRRPGTVTAVSHAAMADYFRTVVDADPDAPLIDAQAVADLVAGAEQRLREPGQPDDMDRLKRRAADLRAKIAAEKVPARSA